MKSIFMDLNRTIALLVISGIAGFAISYATTIIPGYSNLIWPDAAIVDCQNNPNKTCRQSQLTEKAGFPLDFTDRTTTFGPCFSDAEDCAQTNLEKNFSTTTYILNSLIWSAFALLIFAGITKISGSRHY